MSVLIDRSEGLHNVRIGLGDELRSLAVQKARLESTSVSSINVVRHADAMMVKIC